ncbi:esterase/lipase family protein [Hyalangium rubrum]|uniref:Alpha/beta fold hydrolase n=1 Tax=Hyalangium rubrum TaxID=3103134 RepID=A0ABU5GWL5_9BACT|nr:alpha/beta fold hydrolase [Hyalangium sp. s54d21]MDY7224952.1 alpha/beta fold hydrolase [Hyalangium sp. s54d21]
MKGWIVAAAGMLFLLGARAEAQCATTCATVAPKHPVILVHGRNDTAARWDTLVSNWTARGYTEGVNLFRFDMTRDCGANTFCSTLPGYSASFVNESYARCLANFIDTKVPCPGGVCPAVDLVTHSQGGVVARYYARFLANRSVDDLVVMSAPNNGITNCTLVSNCPGVNPEDCPNSALMKKLNGVLPYGDGSNDETPGATATGPVHYAAVVSDGDTVVPPWCGSYFLSNPDAVSGANLDCRRPNYTVDPNATSCMLSKVQHLVVPTHASAIAFAYCEVNKD